MSGIHSNSGQQRLAGLDVCSDPAPQAASQRQTDTDLDDFHGRSTAARSARFSDGRGAKLQTSAGWPLDEFS